MVVWYCDVDMAEVADLTEGGMHPARTPISTPPSAQYRGGQETYQGLPFCLIGEAGGGKGGWEGTSNSLIMT